MKLKNRILYFLIAVFVCLAGIRVSAEVNFPAKPPSYVVDQAGIIQPDIESALNEYLAELEQKTTAQMFILTIVSLEGESLEEFSIHVAHDVWEIGQQGKDNGVLLLVSLEDRKARLEIGYGLEGVLTDAYSKRIIEQVLLPYFRQGDYSNGITAAVSAVVGIIAADSGVDIIGTSASVQGARRTDPYGGAGEKKSSPFQKFISILLVIAGIYLFIRHPRLFILLLMMSGGGRRGGWGGGGGFRGGGGFGGGGGGFGGGGASGSW
ncbi:MAG: TPM domain-containing protein [Acidobacteriota bacterium]|jgi:uncharacterized protein